MSLVRSFAVHARGPQGPARVVNETSFEAAAIAFIEDFAPPADHDGEVSVIVREVETGREHCFRVDLDSGDAAPCA